MSTPMPSRACSRNLHNGNTNRKNLEMNTPEPDDDLRPEYDLSRLRLRRSGPSRPPRATITVALDDDVAQVFTTPEAVNHALRALLAALPPERKSA